MAPNAKLKRSTQKQVRERFFTVGAGSLRIQSSGATAAQTEATMSRMIGEKAADCERAIQAAACSHGSIRDIVASVAPE